MRQIKRCVLTAFSVLSPEKGSGWPGAKELEIIVLLCLSSQIHIFVNPSVVPYSVQSKFTSEEMEQLKVMQIRSMLCVFFQDLPLFPPTP